MMSSGVEISCVRVMQESVTPRNMTMLEAEWYFSHLPRYPLPYAPREFTMLVRKLKQMLTFMAATPEMK